jgi:hypothetical protein
MDVAKHIWLLLIILPPPEMDDLQYWQLASQFISGDWLWLESPIAYRTPGFPAFVALIRVMLGPYGLLGVQIAQHVLVLLTSMIASAMTFRITQHGWLSILTYLGCSLTLTRDFHANLVLTETLFTFLLTASIWVWTEYWITPHWSRMALLGALVGMASLVRPIAVYLGPLLAGVTVVGWMLTSSGRRAAIPVIMLLVVANLLVLPWYLRNLHIFGEPFLTQFVGRNMWAVTFHGGAGNGLRAADAPGTHDLQARLPRHIPSSFEGVRVWTVSDELSHQGLPDDEIDRMIGRAAWEAQRANPLQTLERFARRAVNFWRCVSNPSTDPNQFVEHAPFESQYRPGSLFASRLFHAAERWVPARSLTANSIAAGAAFMGAGLLLVRRETRAPGLGILLTLLYFGFVTAAIEIPTYRYRMILEPAMIATALAGAGMWFERRCTRN